MNKTAQTDFKKPLPPEASLKTAFFTLAFFTALALFILFPKKLSADESLRCDGSLIRAGDVQSKVKEKCGEPAQITTYSEFTIIHNMYVTGKTGRRLADRYILEYRDTSEYLEALERLKNSKHSHADIVSDDNPHHEVESRNPRIWRRRRNFLPEEKIQTLEYKISWICKSVEKNYEEWTYNFGDNRFIRIITFLHGRVVGIQSLEYGF